MLIVQYTVACPVPHLPNIRPVILALALPPSEKSNQPRRGTPIPLLLNKLVLSRTQPSRASMMGILNL